MGWCRDLHSHWLFAKDSFRGPTDCVDWVEWWVRSDIQFRALNIHEFRLIYCTPRWDCCEKRKHHRVGGIQYGWKL